MADKLAQLKRRPFLFPLMFPVVGLALVLGVAVWFVDARGTTVVFVVTHAEAEAASDDSPLSVTGRERAARLVRILYQAQPTRGLDAVYAAESQSTQQTAAPVAETLALPVNVVPVQTWNSLPARIRRQHHGENVLVVGSAATLPELLQELAGEVVEVSAEERDALYIVFLPRLAHSRLIKLHY